MRSALRTIIHPCLGEIGSLGSPLKRGVAVSAIAHSIEVWQVKAACRGPQAAVFFPPPQFERKDEKLDRERRAKAICAACTVREDCLEYAVRIREPHGIWGGLNETERKSMWPESVN
ncbi:MAG: WhiB family transcriptional regulator [Actinobacteria bacterium]|nr:MAG: WhiB family transcriptional regulator [Actinomycetota bacterium]RIK04890.1 MAG: hypothetical protein DCC48_12145 [Acidobacteriota bacterium]